MNSIDWKKAILAGVLGTLLFDVVGLAFTGTWWDIPGILGAKTGLGLAYGVVGHYSNGILLAVLSGYMSIRTLVVQRNFFSENVEIRTGFREFNRIGYFVYRSNLQFSYDSRQSFRRCMVIFRVL